MGVAGLLVSGSVVPGLLVSGFVVPGLLVSGFVVPGLLVSGVLFDVGLEHENITNATSNNSFFKMIISFYFSKFFYNSNAVLFIWANTCTRC